MKVSFFNPFFDFKKSLTFKGFKVAVRFSKLYTVLTGKYLILLKGSSCWGSCLLNFRVVPIPPSVDTPGKAHAPILEAV
jgi:hypothetical protein